MATIGQTLTSPGAGWQRIDQTSQNIYYNFTPTTSNNSSYYNGSVYYLPSQGSTATFTFYGTKLRIITQMSTSRATSINVSVDGQLETYSQYASSTVNQGVCYEKTGLSRGNHTVVITKTDTVSTTVSLDAIDIDDDGCLISSNGFKVRTSVYSMGIGDIIPCAYVASTSGTAGTFSELGTSTAAEIPLAGSATPNGLFYFIKADKGLLIADRNLQTSITWDTLNSAKYIQGKVWVPTKNVTAGSNPWAIWGDATQVYIANRGAGSVTCINRSDNTTVTIPAGTNTYAIWGDSTAVYAANFGSNNVTCINRSDNTTTTITVGSGPQALWGDSTYVYVVNYNSNNATRIKRSDNTTTTITVGTNPNAIWGDSTNVYVPNYGSANVTCIKRSDNTTTTITAGTNPFSVWGDSTQVYVINYTSNNVTCIRRSDNTTTTITVGTNPQNIWGDTTNVYVSNNVAGTITCINRSNNSATTIIAGTNPRAIWGDANKVYVVNYGSGNITCVNRADNTTTTIAAGSGPSCVWGDGANVYIGNYSSANVTCIDRLKPPVLLRSLSGGVGYLGSDGSMKTTDQSLGGWPTDNEWDTYVVGSNLKGAITAGDNNIWHWNNNWSFCQDTPTTGIVPSGYRTNRGGTSIKTFSGVNSAATGSNNGFRPVLEYVDNDKSTNVWY